MTKEQKLFDEIYGVEFDYSDDETGLMVKLVALVFCLFLLGILLGGWLAYSWCAL